MSRRLPLFVSVCALVLSLLPAAALAQSDQSDTADPAPELEAADATPAGPKVELSKELAREADGPESYIVRLQDPAVPTYDGGIDGLEATAVRFGEKLDVSSPGVQAYEAHLEAEQASALEAVEAEIGRAVEVKFSYTLALNGFAVVLEPSEAAQVALLPGVAHVTRNEFHELHTDAGPEHIEAPAVWDGTVTPPGAPGTEGEGVIAGIIDSGISPSNPSFAATVPVAEGGDGYVHVWERTAPGNPNGYYGVCDPTQPVGDPLNPPDATFGCNDKLIGAWNFVPESIFGARDDNGHGSHTGSTVAGNQLDVTITSPLDPTVSDTVNIEGVAPHAHIISYRVCGEFFGGACGIDAIVAAINQATADGVDTINYSIGSGSPGAPWDDPDALAFLNARAAGIFVSVSAGNAGPNPATVGSPSGTPWVNTTGASEHNRYYEQILGGMTGGDTAPPADIAGKGFSGGLGLTPIVYAGDFGNNLCGPGVWTPTTFAGEIVVCDRGEFGRVQKSQVAADAGAGGFVLANDAPSAASLNSDAFAIPGVHIPFEDGEVLKAWLASGTGHQATISPFVSNPNSPFTDMQASFSSRGPNGNADTIAPDVTAPGVDIIAALGAASADTLEPEVWGFLSGTSMSSPHAAGAGTLLSAVHPTWSAAEQQSALMTTARTDGLRKQDNVTPSDPFDHGSGYIDVAQAVQAGLVLDETQADYLAANPAEGGDPRQINMPSMSNRECLQTCSWTRTVTGTETGSWTVSVENDAGLTLSVTPATFDLTDGGTADLTITADVTGSPVDEQFFGQIILTPTDTTTPTAHMPVAVVGTTGIFPDLIEIDTRRDAGSQLAEDFQTIEITDLQVDEDGLDIGEQFIDSLEPDPTNDDPFNGDGGTFSTTVSVPAGATRLVAEIYESTAQDYDLFVGSGDTPSAATVLCASAGATAIEYCELTDPEPGTYWVLVQRWDQNPGAEEFRLSVGVVAGDQGNMTVEGPTSQPEFVPFDMRVFWDDPAMEAGDRLYGSFTFGTSAATPANIGTVAVNLVRHEDDVTKSADVATAEPGDTITYTIEVQPNVTPEDLTYTISDAIPVGMTYVEGSATNGAVVTDGVLTWTGVLPSPFGAPFVYEVSTSDDDQACLVPFGNGFYTDFGALGFETLSEFDGNNLAIAAFTGAAPFSFYGQDYNGLTLTDNAYQVLDFENNGGNAVFDTAAIPDPALPNAVIANLWDDFEIAYSAGDGTPVSQTGLRLLTLGTDESGRGIIDYDGMQLAGGSAETWTFQAWIARGIQEAAPEIVIAYADLASVAGPVTVGVENETGTDATTLVNNGPGEGLIASNMNVCFNYTAPTFDAEVITFQVTADADAPDGIVTNTAAHDTDNLGSRPALTSADVDIDNPGVPAQPTIEALEVTPETVTVEVGATQQFTATAVYTDGSEEDVTDIADWSSSIESVATIDQGGLATGLSTGRTTITALLVSSEGTALDTAQLTVGTILALEVTPQEATVGVGGTQQFTATAVYDDESEQDVTDIAEWSSEDEAVATIDDSGLATGVAEGTATIRADLITTDGGVSDTATLTVTADAEPPPPGEDEVTRIFGTGRIETAIEISQASFGDGEAGAVVLARADTYPDALAGTPLAVDREAPMLLTTSAELLPIVADEIERVLPAGGTVYVLGGENALEFEVDDDIEELGYNVTRLFGASRIETAIAIAQELGDPNDLLITTGYDFPDALSAGAAAANFSGAVLLTTSNEPTASLDDYLATRGPDVRTYGIGGPAARAYPDATPVFGGSREDTAGVVAEEFFADPVNVGLARRDLFADSLAGGAHIGRLGGPLLITPTDSLHPAPEAYLCGSHPTISQGFAYGGSAALSDAVVAEMQARINGDGCPPLQ